MIFFIAKPLLDYNYIAVVNFLVKTRDFAVYRYRSRVRKQLCRVIGKRCRNIEKNRRASVLAKRKLRFDTVHRDKRVFTLRCFGNLWHFFNTRYLKTRLCVLDYIAAFQLLRAARFFAV